jgi:hypothetical protein
VAFSPDGQTLAVGGFDGAVRLWIARPEVLAEMVCEQVWRNLTLEERKRFVGRGVPSERTCPNLPRGEGVLAATPTTSIREAATPAS